MEFDFGAFRRAYGTQVGCVLRGLLYDQWALDFLARHPTGTVVELGAGLTTRFERIDNGQAHWIDVDLPRVIELRRHHFAASPRRTLVEASVLGGDWAPAVLETSAGPYFFVCEGVLMYLEPAEVRRLLVHLADAFGPTEFAFDSIGHVVVRHQSLHDSMKHMMDAPFRWGIDDIADVERWDSRLAVEEVATLPDIARRFRSAVALRHLLAGALVERVSPRLAGAYRLCRLKIGS
jgi:O-methyltransferase involved in polyketide biosynthesis